MTTTDPGRLTRLATVGVAGLPRLELELGPVTAVIGPRGSGKSQLLATIAWLIAGQPALAAASPSALMKVRGELSRDGRIDHIERRGGASPSQSARPPELAMPALSFFQACDRFQAARGAGGDVRRRAAALAAHWTSDAVAAEALVSAVEACCRECIGGEILLIEEPELFLTPQAQRYLYRLLRRFAEGGNQVVYSTRSPAFVDPARHDEIVRLDLRRDGRRLRRTDPQLLTDAERVRLAAEFDHERSEMFFARAVLLVEGQTERLSLPFIFRALGHDPDAEGIAIVEVGGKSNLPLAARLLGQLGVPYAVVFDADRGAASAALDDEIHRAAQDGPVIRLAPDFEAAAGIASHTEKVLHAWQRFASASASDVPPALARIVTTSVGLLGGSIVAHGGYGLSRASSELNFPRANRDSRWG